MSWLGHTRGGLVLFTGFAMLVLPVPEFNAVGRLIAPLQRPLRIAQSWNLYGVGPNRMVRAEVWIDGELRYRSGDGEHTWSRSFLRYRRIRPVVVNTCRDSSPHAERLVQRLVVRAQADHPDATEVRFRCTAAEWPGTGEADELIEWVASAPDWNPH